MAAALPWGRAMLRGVGVAWGVLSATADAGVADDSTAGRGVTGAMAGDPVPPQAARKRQSVKMMAGGICFIRAFFE